MIKKLSKSVRKDTLRFYSPTSSFIIFCGFAYFCLQLCLPLIIIGDNDAYANFEVSEMIKSRNIDMCRGPLFSSIILYTLPLIATGVLQLLYNAADSIVVAKFGGGESLAAVSSNGALINLIINLFMGLSIGASVAVSNRYGANDTEGVHRTVHTAIGISIVSGVVCMAAGIIIARQALVWMGTPPEVLAKATLYLRIYFIGMPASMLYNFASAVLRAVGDTRRPMYILIMSGLINVVLNLILVICFKLDVAGVAIATIVSQLISAVLAVYCLMESDECYRYEIKATRIYKAPLIDMIRFGVPAGVQGTVFSMSNILIQSSINSFGVAAISGNAAAANIEGITYTAMNAMHQTCLAFTSQNLGAANYHRLRRIFYTCIASVTVIGIAISALILLFQKPLLSLYTATGIAQSNVSPADILDYGARRLSIISLTYFLCGIMDTVVGGLRGLGSSVVPMIVSIVGVCGIRVVWIYTLFEHVNRTFECLMWSYPVSWVITALLHYICYNIKLKRVLRTAQTELEASTPTAAQEEVE